MQDLYVIYTIGHLLAETFPDSYNLSIMDRNIVYNDYAGNYDDDKYKRYTLCMAFMIPLMGSFLYNNNNYSGYTASLLPLSMLSVVLFSDIRNDLILMLYYITIAMIFWMLPYNVKCYKWFSMMGSFVIYGLMLMLFDAIDRNYYGCIHRYKLRLNITICILVFMKSLDISTQSTHFWRDFAISFIYVGIMILNFYTHPN